MSGRNSDRGGLGAYQWLRGALVVVAIAAVLGVFGTSTALKRPELSPLNIAGIAVMAVGLVIAVASATLVKGERQRLALGLRLGGVLVCGIGAIMVFI